MKTEWNNAARTIAFVMSLAILHPQGLLAQVNVTSAAGFTGGTVTSPILFPASSCAAPSLGSSSDATDGLYIASNAQLFCINGAETARFASAGIGLGSSNDVLLVREAAATLQLGVDINGAPVNQTLKAHDGITGTDVAGAGLTIASGRGTGAGAVSTLTFSTPTVLGTGTTAQTLAARLTLAYEGAAFPGSAPTVSSCGSSPSAVTGSNVAGRLTTGSGGTLQSCTLTFVPARTAAPSCIANNETAIILLRTTTTTTTLVIDSAVAGTMESDVINYICLGGS